MTFINHTSSRAEPLPGALAESKFSPSGQCDVCVHGVDLAERCSRCSPGCPSCGCPAREGEFHLSPEGLSRLLDAMHQDFSGEG